MNELLFIICSVKTFEGNYSASYLEIKRKYPRFADLLAADEKEIAQTIAFGGLSNQKAKAIGSVLSTLNNLFGRPTLAPLRKLNDAEIEQFLTSLPGVGKKIARCVMLYSFKRDVFPVDTHCWKIFKRLGWIEKEGSPSPKDMDTLQGMVPPDLRYPLHVNLISHGRAVCNTKKPKCDICAINQYCEKRGVQR